MAQSLDDRLVVIKLVTHICSIIKQIPVMSDVVISNIVRLNVLTLKMGEYEIVQRALCAPNESVIGAKNTLLLRKQRFVQYSCLMVRSRASYVQTMYN